MHRTTTEHRDNPTEGIVSEILADQDFPLAADFPQAGHDEWVELAAKVLNKSRGDNPLDHDQVEERLRTPLRGGLVAEALYLPDATPAPLGYPGSMPFTRGLGPVSRDVPWQVTQYHEDPDPLITHKAVLDDLEHGVTALWLQVGDDAIKAADLPAVLEKVMFDLAPISVSGTDQQAAATALLKQWQAAPVEAAAIRGNLGLDPLGHLAVHGGPGTVELPGLAGAARSAVREFTGIRPIVVDARVYSDAGGSEVDQVGCAIATGIAYLRALEEGGVRASDAFGLIEFRVSASADQFLTIAALRALRWLWARVGEVSGVPENDRGAHQHAVSSWRMISRDDPWVNILRTTLACFGAAAGGAQAITTLPHDTAWGLPDTVSRRIARNTQIVLAEESHVAAVADPAGGSWYVENLTEQLATAAWAWLQQIETAGGMPTALASDLVADRLAASRAELDAALSTRAQSLTGVSAFPQPTEEALSRRPRASLETVAGQGLPRRRDSEIFEALRDRSTAAAASGKPPTVYLATLGEQRDFGARQTFVANLLGVAGITAVATSEQAHAGGAQAIAAEAVATSPITVLCSSPRGYAEHAAAAVEALRAAGAAQVLVAGRAKELGETPADGELYDGIDVVARLTELLDTLTGTVGTTKEDAR